MLLATHENPELIWNDEAREKVCSTVKHMKNEYVLCVCVFIDCFVSNQFRKRLVEII